MMNKLSLDFTMNQSEKNASIFINEMKNRKIVSA